MEPTKQGLGCHGRQHNDQIAAINSPFHQYEPTLVQPCVLRGRERGSLHLLDCGHIVAIDNQYRPADYRCGLNCLHVTTWIKYQTMHASAEDIDICTGKTLRQVLESTAPLQLTRHPILPALTQNQSHDKIFCEICYGIPASSYFIMNPQTKYKRALALTRPVIEYYTGYTQYQTAEHLAQLLYIPRGMAIDYKLTHRLCCGHQVWAYSARPCAANCADTPPCSGRNFPHTQKQGDAILCKECVYRAELVYERYAQHGMGHALEEVSRNAIPGGGIQHGAIGFDNTFAVDGTPPGYEPATE